jgi:hypothetical protein
LPQPHLRDHSTSDLNRAAWPFRAFEQENLVIRPSKNPLLPTSIPELWRRVGRWGAALAALGLALSPGAASALSISFGLGIEFDTGQTGTFAHVTIDEKAGDLDFTIQLTGALGHANDLHEFYFNLADPFTGLEISTADDPTTPYTLTPNPTIAGGAGASFDYGVSFGNGGGLSGNGQLASATFTLSALEDLLISDLLESSFAAGGTIEAHVAAHVQGTEFVAAANSETVGTLIPEPATGLFVALGLVALSALRPVPRG